MTLGEYLYTHPHSLCVYIDEDAVQTCIHLAQTMHRPLLALPLEVRHHDAVTDCITYVYDGNVVPVAVKHDGVIEGQMADDNHPVWSGVNWRDEA